MGPQQRPLNVLVCFILLGIAALRCDAEIIIKERNTILVNHPANHFSSEAKKRELLLHSHQEYKEGEIIREDQNIITFSEQYPTSTHKTVIIGNNRILTSSFCPSSTELSALDGTNGFVLNGVDATFDYTGGSVSSAGDVNGDGYDDVIIGADTASNGVSESGVSYVVFGGTNVVSSGSLEMNALDGTNGFVLNGIDASDRSGLSVNTAGDVNGDGYNDLIIGAPKADPVIGGSDAGESYIVFGNRSIGSGGILALSALDGTNGFVLNGVTTGDWSGWSVSAAGDINGDGYDDVIIGTYYAGESYVVFGGTSVGSSGSLELSTLDGTNGFTVNGIGTTTDFSGSSVSGAGDVNGDGYADVIIGAFGVDLNGNSDTGESYIVFGGSSVVSGGIFELSALDGTNGFKVQGIAEFDYTGFSVSEAGDINGDGNDDVIIGAFGADAGKGASYILFGGASIGNSGIVNISALDGTNGFVLTGIAADDHSGFSVSGAGDVNGDGYADMIIGAEYANSDAGASYVVFGGTSVGNGGSLALSALDGTNGFALNGVAAGDWSGSSVSGAGDVNGDGYADMIIGAPAANSFAGESYVVYGVSCAPSPSPSPLPSPLPTLTVLPSLYPTLSPTSVPTPLSLPPSPLPTPSPTPLPTKYPTFSPSPLPTPSPTPLPTKYPTFSPSPLPTLSPTLLPTKYPTFPPSPLPTPSPTLLPTKYPTFSPSPLPTPSPTLIPTRPTEQPTTSPTTLPTYSPTVQCSSGYSFDGSQTCTPCTAGKYTNFNSTPYPRTCSLCPAGQYNTEALSTECLVCATGKLSSADRTQCTDCNAGEYSLNETACVECPQGYYAPQALSDSCLLCAAGSHTNKQRAATTCTACDAGTYSLKASVNCTSCGLGKYSGSGASQCIECSAGFIAAEVGTSTCTACAAGSISATTSSSNCTSCPVGRYQGATGQSSCADCSPGSYASAEGLSSCTTCQGGKYSNASASECFSCSKGTYSTSGASSCLPCAAGFITALAGKSICTACPAGKIAASASSSNCTACGKGTYQGATGQGSCNDCEAGKYANVQESTSCLNCELGKYSYKGSQSCVIADANYYVIPSFVSGTGARTMLSCPTHTTCLGGTFTPLPTAGYWMDHSDLKYLATPYRCSRSTCMKGDNSSNCWNINSFNSSSCKDVQCSEGASGPLCGSCDVNYVFSTTTNTCESCETAQKSAYIILASIVVIAAVLCFVFIYLVGEYNFIRNNPIVQFLSQIESGSLKVLWVTYQIIVSVSFTVEVQFPYPFSGMLGLLTVFSFDFLSLECLNTGPDAYYQVVYLWSALPIVIAFIIVMFGVIRLLTALQNKDVDCTEDDDIQGVTVESPQEVRAKIVSQHMWLLLLLSYVVLPPVSSKQLQSFDCIKLESKERYLRVNTSINCDSDEYERFSFFNLIFILTYQSIPIFWAVLLYRNRSALNPSTSHVDETLARFIRERDPSLSPLKFLFNDYKCNKWWFEIIDMYRRIMFIGIVPLVSPQPAVRSSFGMILAIISVAYFREEQPYAVDFTNVIAHIAQFSILVTFYCALSIESGSLMLFGLEGKELGIFLIFANLAIIALALAFAWSKLKHQRSVTRDREWKAAFTEDARSFSANKFNTTFESIWQNSITSSNVLVFHYTTVKEAKEARRSGIRAQSSFNGVPVTLRRPHDNRESDNDFIVFGGQASEARSYKFPNEEVLVLSLPRKSLEPLPGFEDDDGLYVLPSKVLAAMRPTSFAAVEEPAPWLDGLILLPPQCIIRSFKILDPGVMKELADEEDGNTGEGSGSVLKIPRTSFRVSSNSVTEPDYFARDKSLRQNNSVVVKSFNSINTFCSEMQSIRLQAEKYGLIPLYHYTSPFAAPLILKGGLRMSTQGQGDGGVYVSTQGPASYGVGSDDYEFNLIKDCFGVERVDEYEGKGFLDVVLIYACEPAVFDQAPGGRDNAKMVTKTSFGSFSLQHPDGNFFLRPDRLLGAFHVTQGKSPVSNTESWQKLQSELKEDAKSIEKLEKLDALMHEGLRNFNKTVEKYWPKKDVSNYSSSSKQCFKEGNMLDEEEGPSFEMHHISDFNNEQEVQYMEHDSIRGSITRTKETKTSTSKDVPLVAFNNIASEKFSTTVV